MQRQEQIQHIPLEKIDCEPQVRESFSDESLIGLARSQQENGFLAPIRVRRNGDKFVAVVGERRVRAARLAKFATIPAIIEEKELCEAEVLQRQLVENLQRVDLNPLEKSRALNRLIETTGQPANKVAGTLGMSSASMTRLLALVSLSEGIRAKVEDGTIPASSAYELTRIDDPDKREMLAQQIVEGQLTRDRISDAARETDKVVTEKASGDVKRATAILGNGQSVTVTGPDLTLERFVEIIEGLLGRARKARGRGIELGSFLKLLRNETKTVSAQP